MPLNRSDNKVRVSKCLGTEEYVGSMDPAVSMTCKYGQETRYIHSLVTGNSVVNLALASGGGIVAQAYPHDLTVSYANATGLYSFPSTGAGDVVYGHDTAIAASTGLANAYFANGGSTTLGRTYPTA